MVPQSLSLKYFKAIKELESLLNNGIKILDRGSDTLGPALLVIPAFFLVCADSRPLTVFFYLVLGPCPGIDLSTRVAMRASVYLGIYFSSEEIDNLNADFDVSKVPCSEEISQREFNASYPLFARGLSESCSLSPSLCGSGSSLYHGEVKNELTVITHLEDWQDLRTQRLFLKVRQHLVGSSEPVRHALGGGASHICVPYAAIHDPQLVAGHGYASTYQAVSLEMVHLLMELCKSASVISTVRPVAIGVCVGRENPCNDGKRKYFTCGGTNHFCEAKFKAHPTYVYSDLWLKFYTCLYYT
ncbi:hypothetical protein CB1_056579069 [Camelus ferus]|nr:hypothetical protein CB1_056579069 [Camelus ferus]